MSHYNSRDSFKTKKSIEKKELTKNKSTTNIINIIVEQTNIDYGIVIEVKYNDAYILYNNEIIKAKLNKNINNICNKIIFPGDKVILNNVNNSYIINNIIKRNNILTRTKKDSTRNNDIRLTKYIATNIDIAVIVVSANEPPLHPKFIDRYIMILENSNIPYIICLNKSDLKTQYEENILNIYKNLNINIIEASAINNVGIDELKKYIYGKQAILLGNSGVGKSSLTNKIMNDTDIKIGHVSEKNKRGRHTTTSSKYYIWDNNSSIIDTPGIRSLDISTFKPNDIKEYFKEFNNYKCKYKDCLHYNEPIKNCIIKQEVKNNNINKARYISYLRIMNDILKTNTIDDILNEINN